jgi:hypothetical protein
MARYDVAPAVWSTLSGRSFFGRGFGHTVLIDLADAPLPSIREVVGISNHRLFPRRARLTGGEPSH